MRQLSAFQLVRAHSTGISRGLLSRVSSRSYSIAEGECQAPVEGTFYRSQVDAEGKLFNFGVVVSSLSKGQSALPAWSQACSLLGNNTSSPTLAVAFVSDNTPSSTAAVEEIGKSFSEMLAAEGRGADPKFGVPLIGCVADVWTAGAPASTSPDGGGERKIQAKRSTTPESSCPKRGPAAEAPRGTGSGELKAAGDGASKVDDVKPCSVSGVDSEEEDFKSLVGECARWSRENPGVVPDEENQALNSLDKQLSSQQQNSGSPGTLEKPEEKKNEALALESEEQKSSGVVSEQRSKTPGGSSPGSPGKQQGKQEINAGKLAPETSSSEEEDDDQDWVEIPVLDAREVAEGGGSSKDRAASGEERKFSFGHQPDDCYRMILCVAHMPGAKAVSFHTTKTGFPSLPDMESAILRSNPHMLLLGAPGYAFPEFIQRLATIFTESVRLQSRCISAAPL